MNKFLLGMLLLISFNGFAQNTNTNTCAANPICRVFDFWIGEWEVMGKNNNFAGKSLIQISLVLKTGQERVGATAKASTSTIQLMDISNKLGWIIQEE